MNDKARSDENNEKPFVYHTSDGVIFTSPRCDFQGGIKVKGLAMNLNLDATLNTALVAVAEMIAYHRGEVYPGLNGFAGYDCLQFEEDFEDEEQDSESHKDTQDREYAEDEGPGVSKPIAEIKKGDFLVLWSDSRIKPAEVLGLEDGFVRYRYLDSGDKHRARFDPAQVIKVFARAEDARQNALAGI